MLFSLSMKTPIQSSDGGNEPLGVLTIGGCGFVGYHLVHHFVSSSKFSPVAVASRSAKQSKNQVNGATYHNVDLTDASSIEELIDDLKPTVIMHDVSPSPVTGTASEYRWVAIQGTKDLLRIAKKSRDVQVLIYTSSSLLCSGPEHVNLTEESPLADSDPKAPAYARTKAQAEKLISSANNPLPLDDSKNKVFAWEGYLCTGALRFPIIYGTRDPICIPGALNALEKRRKKVVLGDANNLWSFCSVQNAASSHVLLVQALLDAHYRKSSNLTSADGEAFHIHDGEARKFWDFARMIWQSAGYTSHDERIHHLPTWFALDLSSFLEFVFWIFTCGRKRPYQLGKQQVEYALFEHTYCIDKARKVLGYEPLQDFEEGLRRAVAWSLEYDGWRERLRGVVNGG
ncbi:hypothetical protein EAF00_011150 [Botryotinia globosa]|nr:hypothetical protein EAF00_011150 [Botryotinia globosa]